VKYSCFLGLEQEHTCRKNASGGFSSGFGFKMQMLIQQPDVFIDL